MYDFFIDSYGAITLIVGQEGKLQTHCDRRILLLASLLTRWIEFWPVVLYCAVLAENKLLRGPQS